MSNKRVSPVDAVKIVTDYSKGKSINSIAASTGYSWKTVKSVIVRSQVDEDKATAKCGTTSGYRKHAREGTVACWACVDAMAKYMAEWRKKNGKTKPKKPYRHGSRRTYQLHLRLGETPCEQCKRANARESKRLRRLRADS